MYPGWWKFLLYCPADAGPGLTEIICRRMAGARVIGREEFERLYRDFDGFGEINPYYTGLRQVFENYALILAWPSGRAAGLLVFKPKSEKLVEIDIIALQEELRGLGLARFMYGFFESAWPDGTLLFLLEVTEEGELFYARNGFQRDIDIFKVLSAGNRVARFGGGETEP